MKLSSIISCTVITLVALTCSTTALPAKPEKFRAPLGATENVRDLEGGRLFTRSSHHQHRGHQSQGHGPVDEVSSEAALSSHDLDDGRLFVRSPPPQQSRKKSRKGRRRGRGRKCGRKKSRKNSRDGGSVAAPLPSDGVSEDAPCPEAPSET